MQCNSFTCVVYAFYSILLAIALVICIHILGYILFSFNVYNYYSNDLISSREAQLRAIPEL